MSLIYDAAEIKAWDAYTIQHEPISSLDLMERAATLCAKHILGKFHFKTAALFCGVGNNGGDGLVIARLFALRGIDVTVFVCNFSDKRSLDFETNFERLPDSVNIIELNETSPLLFSSDIIIDCIFGSGLNKPVKGWLTSIIDKINTTNTPVVAIDIPSGLFTTSNDENPLTHIIKANLTLTFQVPKMAFFHAKYAQFVGRFITLNIGLHPDFKDTGLAIYLTGKNLFLNKRDHFSHKGINGYLTVIGGMQKMIGAALLCSKAAFKTGCGYVGVHCSNLGITPLAISLPEAIWLGEDFLKLNKKTTAVAIGPGLGTAEKCKNILESVLQTGQSMVLDADSLTLIAEHPALLDIIPENTILTPHLGELNRLIGISDSPEEHLEKQRSFSIKYKLYIIQKGAYSKLTTPDGQLFINSTGNSSMASAGMGDALTGMIGSFLAQGYSPLRAAINGMYFHGLAGDLAVKNQGANGILTSDLIKCIPEALNTATVK